MFDSKDEVDVTTRNGVMAHYCYNIDLTQRQSERLEGHLSFVLKKY